MVSEKTFGNGKKVVGFRELVDHDTGEVVLTANMDIYKTDVNWEKVWLDNLMYAINLVSEKSGKILMYFIENRDYENKVLVNKEMVIRHTGISRGTVYPVIKKLIEGNIIKQLELGFQVNPNVIFNSQAARKKNIQRMDVVLSYYDSKVKGQKSSHYTEAV